MHSIARRVERFIPSFHPAVVMMPGRDSALSVARNTGRPMKSMKIDTPEPDVCSFTVSRKISRTPDTPP